MINEKKTQIIGYNEILITVILEKQWHLLLNFVEISYKKKGRLNII
jgi:hypothetical protein